MRLAWIGKGAQGEARPRPEKEKTDKQERGLEDFLWTRFISGVERRVCSKPHT